MSDAVPVSRAKRFFTLRNALKTLLWIGTLGIFFYVEENWRGARAWARTKAKWEAKGESLDFNRFIPTAVPDAQNLGALPLFKLEPDLDDKKFLDAVALRKTLRGPLSDVVLVSREGRPDMDSLTRQVASEYAEAFRTGLAHTDFAGQLDEIYPFLTELRAAATTRPHCRFAYDDSADMPAAAALAVITSQIKVTKLLALHALLALKQRQPELALADLKVIYQLLPGAEKDPSFVGQLVALGMSAIGEIAIREGLALHAWNDGQLEQIQAMLKQPDFLADYQFALRAETAGSVLTLNYFNQHRRQVKLDVWLGLSNWPREEKDRYFASWYLSLFPLWPSGWMEQNKWQSTDYKLKCLTDIDSKNHRVFPELSDALDQTVLTQLAGSHALAPWNFIYMCSVSGLATGSQALKFALAQVWLDQARIACGLERYRLVHKAYPDNLDALVPTYLSDVPRDVINGDPYRYRVQSDGTFLLYSVGWNQKDDGGKIVYEKADPTKIDNKQGDWVWPTQKPASGKSP